MIESALLIALEYVAPAECPNQAQFWQSVGRSAPQVRLAAAEPPRRRYSVAVNASEKGFQGELREEGQPVPRMLAAADCRELVEALALMLALSTQPEALIQEPATASAESDLVAPYQAESPGREPSTVVVATANPQRERAATPASSGAGSKGTAAMLGGFVWFGAGPDPLLGVAATLEHGFGPVIVARVEARGATANTRANATFFGFVPQACASTWQPVATLTVCAGVVLGLLPIKSVEYSGPQSSAWVAPLLAARVAKSLAGDLAVELTLEAQHGFIERSYHVKRDDSEFKTSPVTALIMLAVGARF